MYGDEGLKLIREAKRTQAGTLPLYNETVVRNVVKEMRILCEEQERLVALMQEHLDDPGLDDLDFSGPSKGKGDDDDNADLALAPQGYQAAFLVHHAAIERNKRCLLVYHMKRLAKIKHLLWELGALPRDALRRFSPAEAKFAEHYGDLLVGYKRVYESIDVMAVPVPPKELFVCVRVVKDCGAIFTESGQAVVLRANSQHFLKRSDVERLITQGYLKHVD